MIRWAVIFFLLGRMAFATTYYVTQAGAGTNSGLSLGNAKSVAQISVFALSADDVVILNGTFTGALTASTSGMSGHPIVYLFATGAKFSTGAWPTTGAIIIAKDYVTIDGGATGLIGGYVSSAPQNGVIENTDNGSTLGNQIDSYGVKMKSATGVTIRNLVVRNIYVRNSSTDSNAYGHCIAGITESTSFTNFTITNCVLSNAFVGVDTDYGPGSSNYAISYCTAYNCNWGGRCGDRGATGTMTGLTVSNCNFYAFTNWDSPTDLGLHHNGFYAWAESGGTLNGVTMFNNVVGPYFTNALGNYNASTSGLFFSGRVAGPILIYNNLFVDNSGIGPSNALITFGTSLTGSLSIYSNTFLGGSGSRGILISASTGGTTLTTTIRNNLFTGANAAMGSLNNDQIALTSNHNLGFGMISSPFYWSSGGSGGGISLAAWKSATGQDSDFITTDPKVNAINRLDPGSSAIGVGFDLSGIFTSDGNGYPRVTPWDIGWSAYLSPRSPGLPYSLP